MTAKTLEVPRDEGRRWLEQSLSGGFEISAAVRGTASFDRGRFRTFIPNDMPPDQIKFPEVGVFPTSAGVPGLAQWLDELTNKDASCVVIENDLASRTDAWLTRRNIPAAFIGDRVIHWCDLETGVGMAAAQAIRGSASGYPLNAFVVSKSAAELNLVDGQPVAEAFAGKVTESLLAVVVSAFDGQSFAVWELD